MCSLFHLVLSSLDVKLQTNMVLSDVDQLIAVNVFILLHLCGHPVDEEDDVEGDVDGG